MPITQTLVKQPSENRLFSMEFAPLMAEGSTLISVTSAASTPAGLTVGANAVSGTKATVRLSAGTAGVLYKVTMVVVDSDGNTLEGEGLLQVKDL